MAAHLSTVRVAVAVHQTRSPRSRARPSASWAGRVVERHLRNRVLVERAVWVRHGRSALAIV